MVTVRAEKPGDCEAVLAILEASGSDDVFADRGHYLRLVAVDGDEAVLGFIDGSFEVPVPDRAAAAAPAGPQAWGSWIVVAPRYRCCGVGQALVRAFVTEAKQSGCMFFAAMVSLSDDRTERVAFFQRCGMRDLVPGSPEDIVGAPIADILAALAD
jgi:GNAT superfamily N-acetyltransferase